MQPSFSPLSRNIHYQSDFVHGSLTCWFVSGRLDCAHSSQRTLQKLVGIHPEGLILLRYHTWPEWEICLLPHAWEQALTSEHADDSIIELDGCSQPYRCCNHIPRYCEQRQISPLANLRLQHTRHARKLSRRGEMPVKANDVIGSCRLGSLCVTISHDRKARWIKTYSKNDSRKHQGLRDALTRSQ